MTDAPPPWVPPVAQPVAPPVPVVPPPTPPTAVAGPPPGYPGSHVGYAPAPRPPSRGPSTLAIVLIVVGVLAALVVGLVFLVGALASSIESYDPPEYTAAPEPAESPRPTFSPPPTNLGPGGVGDTLTTSHGVSVRLGKAECGLDGAVGVDVVPDGQFCRVIVNVLNESPEQIKVTGIDFTLIGPTGQFTASSEASRFRDQPTSGFLRPGAEFEVRLYFDVPVGTVIDRFEYQRNLAFDDRLSWFVQPTAVGDGPASPEAPPGNAKGPVGTALITTDGLVPDGQFCRVTYDVTNGTDDDIKLQAFDLTLFAGGDAYTTSSEANRFDGEERSAWLQPGDTATSVIYYDIPEGLSPDRVRYVQYYGSAVDFIVS